MKNFFDENVFLGNETAKELYKEVKDLPIFDYHCHLSPKEIAEDRKFYDLGELWLEGDHYTTSQGIKIDKREGDLLLKLYRNNRLQHGYKISIYTVLSVCDSFVKIGCHKIPARNLQELAQ